MASESRDKYLKLTIDSEYNSQWLLRSRFDRTSLHKYDSTVVYDALSTSSKNSSPWLTGNDIDIEQSIFVAFVV